MKNKLKEIFKKHDPAMAMAMMMARKRQWTRLMAGNHTLYQLLDNEDFINDLSLKPSAVLVPIVERGNDLSIMLTKRSTKLKSHSGQVSFPGGCCDTGDAHAMATALREAREEINMPEANVEVIGAMEDYETVTGFSVSPVVGFADPDFQIIRQESEVEDVFEVPLEFILNPDNHIIEQLMWNGVIRHYYTFPHDKYKIWGATAAMLVRFAHLVNDYENT